MKLTFRQGIARHQTDISGNPTFLQRSGAASQFIDLVVSPEPTVLVFAHREGTYLVEELKTVQKAWGPIPNDTVYLYWDVNLLTGQLTRGMTLLPPLYSVAAPGNPKPDQHWFDSTENVFRVWNGTKWVDKLRIFAGWVTSGSIIHPIKLGSQAGISGDFEGGHIVLDSFGMPLRQSNGCFVTTASWLNVVNFGTVTARLDGAIMNGMAAEELPKFSLVQLRPGRRLVLARSTDYTSRVSGIIAEDLYEGEISRVISTGVVRNPEWNWPAASINKALFCGPTGQVTLVAPKQGVVQQVGFVYDKDSIFLNVHQVIVLDDPENILPTIPSPPIDVPLANFTCDVTEGIAPLTVQFQNTSVGANALEWDFSNDGYVDSTSVAPSYTFSTPGLYTVRLRAINDHGFDDEIKANLINVAMPSTGPSQVNLGIQFGAPATVNKGALFSFQIITTNDGKAEATHVKREVVLRSSNGSEVVIKNPAAGVVVTKSGALTKVTLPETTIASGGYTIFNLQAQADATASAIQLDGIVSSLETDPTQGDNTASLTIGVRA